MSGQQHSTIKPTRIEVEQYGRNGEGRNERLARLKIQDLAKRTLSAGGCGVEVLWRDFGDANSDLPLRA